jgi:hypothetical protein
VLAKADPLLKREVYSDLGIRMRYRPADEVLEVSADPVGLSACRRGDLNSGVGRAGQSSPVRTVLLHANLAAPARPLVTAHPGSSTKVRDHVVTTPRAAAATDQRVTIAGVGAAPIRRRAPVQSSANGSPLVV